VHVVRRRRATTAFLQRHLSAREFRRYLAYEDELKRGGCVYGGYRLLAADGGDFPMCCRHLFRGLRMFTIYAPDGEIWIPLVAPHTASSNPHAEIAEGVQGLSSVGRRRRDKPPCCDDPAQPPAMSEEARAFVACVCLGVQAGMRPR